MDVQGFLRQKDAELEQRSALLLKTKAAIEQLQEELAGARQEKDKWRKVAERQGIQLADAQRQVQLLEVEVESKARDSSALLSDTLAIKRQLQDARDGLNAATDTHSAQHAALLGKLKGVERALAASQAEAEAVREQAAEEAKAAKDQAAAAVKSARDQAAAQNEAAKNHAAAVVDSVKEQAAMEVKAAKERAAAESKVAWERVAALQALVSDKESGLAEQAGMLHQMSQQRRELEAVGLGLAEQLAAAQRQSKEAAAAAEHAQGRLAARVQQLEAQLSKEAEARQRAEQAAAASKEALDDEQRRQALEGSSWERRLLELQQDAAERLVRREEGWAGQRDALKREATEAVDEARRQLTKRLYLAEGEWACKLQQCSADWAAKLDAVAADWQRRCESDKAAWAAERAHLQDELDARQAEAQRAGAAAVEEMKQHYRRKVAAVEAKAAAAAQAADRVWQQRLEAAISKAQADLRAAADSSAATACQREQQLQDQVAAMQEACAAKLAEQDKQWSLKLAAAGERGLREKYELEHQWADKLQSADKAAAEAHASLRSQIDARLAALSLRLGTVVQKEVKQERKRAELLRRVAELEACGEGERGRGRELEAALAEASATFKRELADKSQQLDLLRQEIKFLRCAAGGDVSAASAAPVLAGAVNSVAGLAAAATMTTLSPPRCARPCIAGSPTLSHNYRDCCGNSPAHTHCFSAPSSPVHAAAASAAAAARAVEAEVHALRSARRAYQRATLGQQYLCASMARTINDALKRDQVGATLPTAARPRSANAGCIPAAGRRKWKRDLAAELQGL